MTAMGSKPPHGPLASGTHRQGLNWSSGPQLATGQGDSAARAAGQAAAAAAARGRPGPAPSHPTSSRLCSRLCGRLQTTLRQAAPAQAQGTMTSELASSPVFRAFSTAARIGTLGRCSCDT